MTEEFPHDFNEKSKEDELVKADQTKQEKKWEELVPVEIREAIERLINEIWKIIETIKITGGASAGQEAAIINYLWSIIRKKVRECKEKNKKGDVENRKNSTLTS